MSFVTLRNFMNSNPYQAPRSAGAPGRRLRLQLRHAPIAITAFGILLLVAAWLTLNVPTLYVAIVGNGFEGIGRLLRCMCVGLFLTVVGGVALVVDTFRAMYRTRRGAAPSEIEPADPSESSR